MNGKTFDYDPMVYDTMRELANQLGEHYVHQSYEATTDAERDHWRLVALDVSHEAEAVDPYDEAAVRQDSRLQQPAARPARRVSAEPGALDDATAERIFTDCVAPTLFACMTASAQPVGAIVGVRPGAGKTHAVAVVGHEIAPDYFLLPRA